jgi:TM2 domain-containing membrane protein YozV
MRLKQVLIVILISAQGLYGSQVLGQTAQYLIDSAQKISAAYPNIAEQLYERVLYFNQNDSTDFVLHNKIADLFIQQNRSKDAVWHLKKATYINPSPQSLLKLSWCYLWSNQPIEAIDALDTSMFWDEFNTNERTEATIILGLAFEKLGNVNMAVTYYNNLVPLMEQTEISKHHLLNKKLYKPRLKNTKLAVVFSAIIPGLGQLYAGYPRESANSFILNGTLITGAVLTSLNYTWIDGTLAFAGWIPRYYIGGINRAIILTKQKNEQKKEYLFQERITLLKRLKPLT